MWYNGTCWTPNIIQEKGGRKMQTFDEATELSKNFLAARETVESMLEAACDMNACWNTCNAYCATNDVLSGLTGWAFLELQG